MKEFLLASQVITVDMYLALYCHKPYMWYHHLPAECTDCDKDGWPIGVDNVSVALQMRKQAGIDDLVPGR